MRGIHCVAIGEADREAIRGGDFVGAGCRWAEKVAGAARVDDCTAVVGDGEGGN